MVKFSKALKNIAWFLRNFNKQWKSYQTNKTTLIVLGELMSKEQFYSRIIEENFHMEILEWTKILALFEHSNNWECSHSENGDEKFSLILFPLFICGIKN
jgi:hypothetical protein